MAIKINARGIVLASGSPRRRELLSSAGLDFKVIPAAFDENSVPFSEPSVYTKILAENKTMEIARQYPEWIVIGADTIVVIDGLILGKPSSKSEARRMLAMLSGRTHKVFTAYCVAFLLKNRTYSESIFTEVTFKSLSDAEIEWYASTDEPYDKAGAYALQGKGVFMAESLKGSYTNVIGLPVSHVMSHLLEQGFINY